MEGMPTIPGKDPEIMSSGEIAIAKRQRMLNKLLQHGDPFTDRFICSLGKIFCIAKEIVETESIPRYALKKGINGSNIFDYGPCEIGKDFTVIKPVMEKLKESAEKFRIGFGIWENTYSFKDYDELIQTIIQCLLDKTKQLKMTSNCIIDAIPTEGGIVDRIKVYQNENGVSLEVKYTNGLNDHYCNFGKGKEK